MKYVLLVLAFLLPITFFAQNIAINTDGTAGETNVMLDVKGGNAKATNTTQNIFQIKSDDASGSELKLRLILGNNVTASSRYGAISVEDFAGPAYRALSLQPYGGNVGIGTTDPLRKLHVYGIQSVLRLENTGAAAWAGIEGLTGGGTYSGYFGFRDNDGRFFIDADAASNTDDLVVTQSGNVGIGITGPIVKLDILGTNAVGEQIVSSTVDPAGQAALYVGSASGGGAFGHYSGKLVFSSANTTDVSAIRYHALSINSAYDGGVAATTPAVNIDASGNVGIGTGTPIGNLDIKSDRSTALMTGAGAQVFISGTGVNTNHSLQIGFETQQNFGLISTINYGVLWGAYPVALQPYGGNVCIGISNPDTKLHIQNGATAGLLINLAQITGAPYGIGYGGVGTLAMAYLAGNDAYGSAAVSLGFQSNTDYTSAGFLPKLTVLRGGNVGIGTTSPSSKLQVVGLPQYANNAAAAAAGLTVGAFYRDGGDPDHVCVVH